MDYISIALLTLLIGQEFHARQVLASVFVMVWAVRIAGLNIFGIDCTSTDPQRVFAVSSLEDWK